MTLLAGCGPMGDPAPSDPPPGQAADQGVSSSAPGDAEADAHILEQVSWLDGDEGVPTLEFSAPLGVTQPTARLIADGDGAQIEALNSVTFEYEMFAGDSSDLAYSSHESGRPQTIVLSPGAMSQAFADVLVGRHVGAKIVFATPDTSGSTVSDYLVTMFMAVTVVDAHAIPTRADGTPVAPVAGLPAVTLDDTGQPNVRIPAGEPPAELVSQPLIEGSGAVLASGQTVILQLRGWLWATGEQFDSTWEAGTMLVLDLSTESTIPGLVTGLVGKRVGSQVLLVVPPSLGMGSRDGGAIPPSSTLVYVVDVLDVSGS